MKCAKAAISEDNDEFLFRNNSGMSVEGFLELLSFYLSSTFVGRGEHLHVQQSGVCIGSRVAPVLSYIFLSKIDRALECDLTGIAERVFRYVDDYLVVVPVADFTRRMVNVLKAFT